MRSAKHSVLVINDDDAVEQDSAAAIALISAKLLRARCHRATACDRRNYGRKLWRVARRALRHRLFDLKHFASLDRRRARVDGAAMLALPEAFRINATDVANRLEITNVRQSRGAEKRRPRDANCRPLLSLLPLCSVGR